MIKKNFLNRMLILLFSFCLIFTALVLLSQEKASAWDAGDGGGGGDGSGGRCSAGWYGTTAPATSLRVACGETGSIVQNLNEAGANKCVTGAAQTVLTFYAGTSTGWWLTNARMNASTAKTKINAMIDQVNLGADNVHKPKIKSLVAVAIDSRLISGGRTNTSVICILRSDIGATCGALPGVTSYVYKAGRTSNYVSTAADPYNDCFLRCPVTDRTVNPNFIRPWIYGPGHSFPGATSPNRSNAYIPRGTVNFPATWEVNTNAITWTSGSTLASGHVGDLARGHWCAYRQTVAESFSTTAYRSTVGEGDTRHTDDLETEGDGFEIGEAHPYNWTTEVLWGTEDVTQNESMDWDVANDGGTENARKNLKTKYGEMMETYLDSSYGTVDVRPTETQVNAVLAQDAATDKPDVDLSTSNRETFARGGVLTTQELTNYISLNLRKTKQFRCDYTHWSNYRPTFNLSGVGSIETYYNSNQGTECNLEDLPTTITPENENVNTYNNWTGTDEDVDLYHLATTPEVTAAWQSLSVKCNEDGFYNAASAEWGIGNLDTFIHMPWTGSAYTSVKTPQPIDGSTLTNSPLNQLTWGQAGRAETRNNTQYRGLYDKECAFNGVRTETAEEGLTQHFRDNDFANNEATVDLFVPRNETWDGVPIVRYNGTPAVSTTVTRWLGGTPVPLGEGNNAEGAFRMASDAAGNQNQQFFSGSEEIKGQKNYSVDTYSSRVSGLVPGQANIFYVASDWASDKGKPQVLTFKYEFEPDLVSTLPSRLGFTNSNNFNLQQTTSQLGIPVQGKVMAKPGHAESPAVDDSIGLNLFELQMQNTGSLLETDTNVLVDNNFDNSALRFGSSLNEDGEWNSNPRNTSPFYRVINFVRSVGE